MKRLNQRWTQSSYGFPKSEHFFWILKRKGSFGKHILLTILVLLILVLLVTILKRKYFSF